MTTPGGVPNLPMGALTLDTLAADTQDMSGTAMKTRAVERFPSIFNASTGLDPSLDITPFGILTRIWAEVNSLIANADPADVQGPDDIPDLVLEFIEGLPFVGQFVELLDAILGTYGGTDTTLLSIQTLFIPINALAALLPELTNVIGAFQGIDLTDPGAVLQVVANLVEAITGTPGDLADLTSFIGPQWESLTGVLTALQGINLNDPGSVLTAIGDTTEAFAQQLVALLGNVPIIGTYLQSLAGTLIDAIDAALSAIRTATANQQIIGTPGAQNPWTALIPGFFTFPLGSARDTDLLTLNAATSYGGFIAPGESSPIAGLVTALKKTGTVTTANMDLYKLTTTGPNAGVATLVWSSPDFASSITTGSDPALLQMDFPSTVALIAAPTDVFLSVLRMTGAGSISVVGYGTNNVAAPSGYFPTKPGFTRNPTTTPAPTPISTASMASLYSNQRPFMQLARYPQSTDPGGGPVTPPVALMKFADAFNRNPSTNAIRLGSDWTSEKHSTDAAWSPVEGYLSIINNALIFGPKEFGGYGIGRQGALYKYAAGSNSARVGGLIQGPNAVPSGLVMSAAADWSSWIGVFVTGNSVQIRVGTSFDAYTPVKDIAFTLPTNPTPWLPVPVWIWLGYDETTNTFTAYSGIDGTTILGSWVDQSHLVTHDSAHRLAGCYQQLTGGTSSGPIDEFRLEDLVAGTPDGTMPPAPPSAAPVINRFVDFQDKPDGAFPDPAWKHGRVGAGSAFMTVKHGAGVQLSSGTASAACYANVFLTDGAAIGWAIGGYKFADNNTQAVCAMVWWTYTFPEGLTAIIDEVSPMHIVLYPNGYVLQVVATGAPGGPVFNIGGRIYPVIPAAGTVHQIQITFNAPGKPANTITVIGADGHSDDYTNSSLGAAAGLEGCLEILDTNPANDREEAMWVYGGFDSVIGGRVPVATPFTGVAQKAVMAAAGQQNGSGLVAAKTQAALMAGLGTQQQTGVAAPSTLPAVMAAAAASPVTGTSSPTTQKATMSATGDVPTSGALAANTPVSAMSAGGTQSQSGTAAPSTLKPVMAATGAQTQSGTAAPNTLKAVMAATGTHTAAGASFSDTFNRADGAIGNGWTNQMAVVLRILSNIATPDFVSNYGVALSPTVMNTAKHYAEITINTVNAADAYLIYAGSKTTAQVIAFIQPNSSIQVFTKTTAYSSLVGLTNVGTASSSTAANGDVFRFEFDNGVVTLKRNGSALTGVTSLNVSGVTSTDGRDILIAANVGASTRGIDAFASADF